MCGTYHCGQSWCTFRLPRITIPPVTTAVAPMPIVYPRRRRYGHHHGHGRMGDNLQQHHHDKDTVYFHHKEHHRDLGRNRGVEAIRDDLVPIIENAFPVLDQFVGPYLSGIGSDFGSVFPGGYGGYPWGSIIDDISYYDPYYYNW